MRRSGVIVFSLGIIFFGSSLFVFFGGCGMEFCGVFLLLGLFFGVPAMGIGAGLMFLPLPRIERPVDPKKWGLELIGLGAFVLIVPFPFFFPEFVLPLGALGLSLLLIGVGLWLSQRKVAASR